MYTLLRQGDRLPSVGFLQVLLNCGIAGTKLDKDGDYGPKTKKAVQDFQRTNGLIPDDIVGKNTWPCLTTRTRFCILNAVDITDPDVLNVEGEDLRRAGGNPSLIGYMCNGIGQLMQDLVRRMSQAGKVALLRFYGHGSPGNMGISDGVGRIDFDDGRRTYLDHSDRSAFTPGTVAAMAGELRRLTSYFGPYSSVELHGCRVAGNSSGRQMLRNLALIWNVPVSAGIRTQFAGGTSTFRFEGPVHTAFPGGGGNTKSMGARPAGYGGSQHAPAIAH